MKISIGTKGKFGFTTPFNVNNSDVILEVVSISDITELELNSLKPFELIYKPVGLTLSDMYTDIGNKVKIIVMRSNGKYLYVPDKYFDSTTVQSYGKIYTSRTIIMKLCALPKDEDLNVLIQDLTAIVSTRLGVIPNIEEVITSADTIISEDEHDSFEVDRKTIKGNKGSLSKQVFVLEKTLLEKNELIDIMKCKLCE